MMNAFLTYIILDKCVEVLFNRLESAVSVCDAEIKVGDVFERVEIHHAVRCVHIMYDCRCTFIGDRTIAFALTSNGYTLSWNIFGEKYERSAIIDYDWYRELVNVYRYV